MSAAGGVTTLSEPTDDPTATLLRLTNGYQVSQSIHVAATLNVADLVADEPRAAAELATALAVNEDALYRLLRALATVGIFREVEGRSFVATPMSALLRSGHPRSMRGWPVFIGRPQHWTAWGDLLNCVRTGEDAPHHLLGESVWEYRAREPGEASIFNAAMAAISRGVTEALVEAYDFDRYARIVDVGGADGTLLVGILSANPRPHGVVFDLPRTVADAAAVIDSAGLGARCDIVPGSFYERIPAGGDAYILRAVLHDCTDEQSRQILQNIHGAMAPDGKVLIIEGIMQPAASTPRDAFTDLNMLVATGGRERDLQDWETVLASAGFELAGTTATASRFHVIEARRSG